jgi:sporulation protein YtfJ
MSNHPIEGLMNSAMENLKSMIDVNTIIGDPVETPDGSVIMTVSKVGFGYAAGGSDYQISGSSQVTGEEKRHPFGGGAAGGVSITPIAFLIVNALGVKMLHLDENTHLIEKILESAPVAMDKVGSMISKMGDKKNNSNSQSASDSSSNESGNGFM